MTDSRISDLVELTGSNAASDDEFVIVDVYPNANQSKKIKLSELVVALNRQTGTVDTLPEVLTNGNTTDGTDIAVSAGDDITFADSSKAIFGAGSDLSVYHDGSNSVIHESGVGNLIIKGSNFVDIQPSGGGAYMARFEASGAASLFFNNAAKLSTQNTGIDVNGTITTDGLTVSDSTGVITIQDNDNDQNGSTSKILFNHSSGNIGYVGFDGSQDMSLWNANYGALSFGTNNATRVTITNNGNVGVGTTSPNLHGWTKAVTLNTSSNGGYEIGQSGTKYGAFALQGDGRVQLTNFTANPLTFQTNNTEAFRVDSSQNVLIGTTTSTVGFGNSIEGVNLRSEGRVFVSADNEYPLNLSRNTSDGDIAVFRKDGATVGSIGTAVGNAYYAGTSTGVTFGSANLYPTNASGTKSDAALTLGSSSYRFKDLYLSNAVVQSGVKATTTSTSQVTLETFAHASHDGAKVVITAATSADTYVTELLIATNGTTAVATEYGQIATGSALATYDVDISGADVRIRATPASATSTSFRVAMTLT